MGQNAATLLTVHVKSTPTVQCVATTVARYVRAQPRCTNIASCKTASALHGAAASPVHIGKR